MLLLLTVIAGKGDLFGSDIDFDDPITVCNYDVRSLTYSELQCISTKGLTDVLLLYPDFAEKFSKDIHNELTYNLRQTADDSDEVSKSSERVLNESSLFVCCFLVSGKGLVYSCATDVVYYCYMLHVYIAWTLISVYIQCSMQTD